MTWISPLEMETWIVNVFAGNPEYFIAIALFAIVSLAAYFRMNTLTMFFMITLFVIMFSGLQIMASWITLIAIIGGLLAGLALSKIFAK
jgi:hypothetical protein